MGFCLLSVQEDSERGKIATE